jgi:DNA-binding SARP family transcriptional activator/tetratricopeptide (TPR) repeat protein
MTSDAWHGVMGRLEKTPVEIALLGPVAAHVGGRPANLGARKQRCVLAVLALDPNKPVPTERLIGLTWPQGPPATARGMIHAYVSGLRTILTNLGIHPESVRLDTEDAGYVLRCNPQCIDVFRFGALVAEARRTGDVRRVGLLEQALGLWRGPPLTGAVSEEVRIRLCGHLDEARLTAIEDRTDAQLRLDQHDGLIAELYALTSENPTRPRLAGALMRVLHRTGRTADALEHYQGLQQRLREELGLDPPAQLRELHRAILRDDPSLVASRLPDSATARPPLPRQLPRDLATFTGRGAELAHLLTLPGSDADQDPPLASPVIAISGMAGVGKTALAVHAAHRLAERFPDGQLFLDLHGFSRGRPPMRPHEALDLLLRSLGVGTGLIPPETDARAAMCRSRLFGTHVLILLDNVANEAQVQPLLPASPGCLVMVTSRRRLAGLDDTRPLPLDVFPLPEAVSCFDRITGQDHAPELVAEIVELCGRLPLAIRIASARLRARPAWTATDLAEHLRDHRHRLALLGTGSRSVNAAIDLSYHRLLRDQRRMLRQISLHPGNRIESYAAAALTGTSRQRADRLLGDLVDAHVLQEPVAGRFQFHNLVREYAAQAATRADPKPDRAAALTRLFDYYAETAAAAAATLYPYELRPRPHPPRSGTIRPSVDHPAAAEAWLDAELDNLLVVAAYAASRGWPALPVRLSRTLHRHLHTRANYEQARHLHAQALSCAIETGDRPGELAARCGLGEVERMQGRYRQAAEHGQRSLEIARAIGDQAGGVRARWSLGLIHCLQGRYHQAAETFHRALPVARSTGDCGAETELLRGLGDIEYLRGRHATATGYFERSLWVARESGHQAAALHTLISLGLVHQTQGRPGPATHCFQQALENAVGTGDRVGELRALLGFGHVHHLRRRYQAASDYYRQSLEIARRIGDRNGQLEASHRLGSTDRASGRPQRALARHQVALDLAGELGQQGDRARAHSAMAYAHHDLGEPELAGRHWRRAAEILTELGVDQVAEISIDRIRAALIDLDESQRSGGTHSRVGAFGPGSGGCRSV